MSDPAKYRSRTELDEHKKRDPLVVTREQILAAGVSEDVVDDIDAKIDEAIDAALKFAEESEPAREELMHKTVLVSEGAVMREIRYREAVREAMIEEMDRDENVFLMGEEVGHYQGAYKVSEGLLERFGERRVIDTPIAEAGVCGNGSGCSDGGAQADHRVHDVEFLVCRF